MIKFSKYIKKGKGKKKKKNFSPTTQPLYSEKNPSCLIAVAAAENRDRVCLERSESAFAAAAEAAAAAADSAEPTSGTTPTQPATLVLVGSCSLRLSVSIG